MNKRETIIAAIGAHEPIVFADLFVLPEIAKTGLNKKQLSGQLNKIKRAGFIQHDFDRGYSAAAAKEVAVAKVQDEARPAYRSSLPPDDAQQDPVVAEIQKTGGRIPDADIHALRLRALAESMPTMPGTATWLFGLADAIQYQ